VFGCVGWNLKDGGRRVEFKSGLMEEKGDWRGFGRVGRAEGNAKGKCEAFFI
jgi:hypothetical protein